jgi:hypothetical protein
MTADSILARMDAALAKLQAVEQQRRRREYTELLRELTARAHNDRRPGQTIADRVLELRKDLAA